GSGGKGGTVAGGGIYVSWGSAQILRCTIDGCLIRGGRGADGSNGASGSDDDMRYISWGGTGGYGGGAYGGGICIDQWARGVLIEDSTITNCRAVGGVGGNGGNGGNRADGGDAGAPGPAFGGGIYVAQGADVSIEGTSMEGCEAVGGLGGDGGERDGAAWPGFGGGTPYDPLQGDPTQYTAKGGGLYYEDYSTATIRDCTFSGNIVRGSVTGVGELFAGGHREEPQKNYQLPGYGAGMFVGDYSHVTVTNCSFSDNLADLNPNPGDESAPVFLEYFIEGYIGYGGGVCFEGISVANTHVSVDGSYFSGNDSQIGGGLYAAGCDLDVHNSSFVGNKSSLGGGLFVIDSLSDISQCSMMDNVVFDTLLDPELVDPDVYTEATIPGAGGGIYSFNTRALISDCQITHNAVGDSGGGLYLGGHPESIFYYDGMLATSTVRNCLITGNSAGQHGGGVVFDWYAEGQILNSTIADNAVGVLGGYGGGLYVGSEGHASVTDSIIWGNAGLNGSQIALGSSGNVSAMPAALDVVYSAIQDLEGADDIEVV
ncbi:MAG: right-handed parallel beta-helix repeat-containing protein, partial [Planctomycetes bacterium]|nr:right-handed parallel beta-helix repeat-containing protein [Planctomycetota bacterium]